MTALGGNHPKFVIRSAIEPYCLPSVCHFLQPRGEEETLRAQRVVCNYLNLSPALYIGSTLKVKSEKVGKI